MTTTTDDKVRALVDLVLEGNLSAAFPVAESLRDDDPAVEQMFYRPTATDVDISEQARVSHVQWLAAQALESTQAVYPHALRAQEEAVHALHAAMNEAETLTGYAAAVTVAAERVEELEVLITDLEKIAHPLHVVQVDDQNEDAQDDVDPAGDCDA